MSSSKISYASYTFKKILFKLIFCCIFYDKVYNLLSFNLSVYVWARGENNEKSDKF